MKSGTRVGCWDHFVPSMWAGCAGKAKDYCDFGVSETEELFLSFSILCPTAKAFMSPSGKLVLYSAPNLAAL